MSNLSLPRQRRPFLVALLLGACLSACASGDPVETSAGTSWRAEVDTTADTITIRTVGGSGKAPGRLVEELRIGAEDGADHLMFGQVAAIAVRSNGEILIHDGQATALRRFGPDGSYLGTILRRGSGPGEYQNVAGLAVLPDDRLVVHDFGNHRFNVYDADTTFLENWLLSTNVAEWRPIHEHDGGSIYLHDRVILNGESERTRILVRLDQGGRPGDTIVVRLRDRQAPALEVRSASESIGMYIPFYGQPHWSVTQAGELVTIDGDRYAIDIHRRDGKVLRLIRTTVAVPVSPAERAAEEERITARFRRSVPTWSWDGPPIPSTKPPIDWLHTGQDGTIWVRVPQAGTPVPEAERTRGARSFVREPTVFDVFAADGKYEGEVHAPEHLQLAPYPVIDAERVWAVVRDENGVNYVARFRIERK